MCPYRLCMLCAGSLHCWRHNASTASAWTHVKLIGPSVEYMRKIALKMAAALDLKMAAPLDLKMETPLLLKMAVSSSQRWLPHSTSVAFPGLLKTQDTGWWFGNRYIAEVEVHDTWRWWSMLPSRSSPECAWWRLVWPVVHWLANAQQVCSPTSPRASPAVTLTVHRDVKGISTNMTKHYFLKYKHVLTHLATWKF